MLDSKGKISLRQTFFIYLIIAFSPAIRFMPMFAAEKAKQAAWLSPLPAVIPMLIMIFIFSSIFKSYKGKTLMEAIYDIFGTWIGKGVVCIYFLWSFWLTAMYLRYDIERLVSSSYPNMDISFFAVVTIIMIAYILPKGIIVIGRMAEILFPLILLTFIFLFIFLIPNIRTDSLIPISTKDIVPILHGSFVTTSIGSYIVLIFFMREYINDNEKMLKSGVITALFYVLLSGMLIFITVGTLTSSVTRRLPIPFLVAVKQISILGIIEKIESVVVGAWIYADFILLSTLTFITLNILKSLLKLKEIKHLLNIFLVLIYLIALGITINRFELSDFSKKVMVYANSILGFGIPLVLFGVGKIRRKV